MSIASEIYKKTIQYLNDEVNLSELEKWLVPNLGKILSLRSCRERDLAGEIELNLSEITSGHRSESEFKKELRNLLQACSTEFDVSLPIVSSGEVNVDLITLDMGIPGDSSTVKYDSMLV